MEKKNRTLQQVASQSDNCTIHTIKPAPKKHRARVYMLRTGVEGWTENDILKYCRLSSGRNYGTELIRELGINLERIKELNPDGIGYHLRYRFVSRSDVVKVIQLINRNAKVGRYNGMSQLEINDILTLYPEFTAA